MYCFILQDHNHLWVVQSVQGDPLRELFSRRSVESFLSQLEARRGKTAAADFSPPLQDLGVGEGGPAAKKPRLTLDEGIYMCILACTFCCLRFTCYVIFCQFYLKFMKELSSKRIYWTKKNSVHIYVVWCGMF